MVVGYLIERSLASRHGLIARSHCDRRYAGINRARAATVQAITCVPNQWARKEHDRDNGAQEEFVFSYRLEHAVGPNVSRRMGHAAFPRPISVLRFGGYKLEISGCQSSNRDDAHMVDNISGHTGE